MRNFWPLFLALGACSGGGGPEYRQPQVVQPFIPPDYKDRPAVSRSGPRPAPLLMPGDLLRISVYRQPDLDLEVRILDTGMISYPLVGAVQAVGKAAAALEETLRQKLQKDFLENPSVTVTVKEYAKRRVYIVGGVAKPDGYEIAPDGRMTVFQLVAAAGGFTDRAYKEYVQVIRRQGADRTVIRLSLVDSERRLARGEADADLELWPEDLVMIPSAVRVAYDRGCARIVMCAGSRSRKVSVVTRNRRSRTRSRRRRAGIRAGCRRARGGGDRAGARHRRRRAGRPCLR